MENQGKDITKLSEDIYQIFQKTFGGNAEMIRLCSDHKEPYLLPDKLPVFNITQDEFVGLFDTGPNHFFLSSGQVIRFGIHCKLGLPGIIALMLKAEWENFICAVSDSKSLSGLTDDPEIVELYLPDFKPDKKNLFQQIKQNSNAAKNKLNNGQIDFFINDLLERRLFLMSNVRVTILYPEMKITEEMYLMKIPVLQKEEFIRTKELWKMKSTALEDMLLNLERVRKMNLGKEDQYFRLFGDLESGKSRYSNRLRFYNLIVGLMQKEPFMSYRELIITARERLADSEIERMELEGKIKRSRNYIETLECIGTTSMASYEFTQAYTRECKALLNEIYKLLHEDTSKNYCHSFHEKRDELDALWMELMKSTKDELFSYSPSMLLYSYPEYQQLLSIYQRACKVLGKNPDFEYIGDRLEYMIGYGAPLDAVLEYLRNEIKRIEIHLAHIELIRDEYTSEKQTRYYFNACENADSHSEMLKSEIKEIKEQIRTAKKTISLQHVKAADHYEE